MQVRRKVEAKNALENYAYSLRNTLRDEKVWSRRLPNQQSVNTRACIGTLLFWEDLERGCLCMTL